jgi:hypothetical protein
MGTAQKASHGSIQARYAELDEGHLKSLVQAMHGHAGQYKKGRECVRYIGNTRHRIPHAISKVPQTRLLHLDWRGGGRL